MVTTFMATLLFIGIVGLIAAALVPQIREVVVPYRLEFAAVIAVLAMASSLYLSGIADLTPCRYCWWQRIFMYPLAIILPIAAVARDRKIRRYGLPLAVIGILISIRHIWVQEFPPEGGSCDPSAPCALKLVDAYGFLTIPMMTLGCFALIIVLLGWDAIADRRSAVAEVAPAADRSDAVL